MTSTAACSSPVFRHVLSHEGTHHFLYIFMYTSLIHVLYRSSIYITTRGPTRSPDPCALWEGHRARRKKPLLHICLQRYTFLMPPWPCMRRLLTPKPACSSAQRRSRRRVSVVHPVHKCPLAAVVVLHRPIHRLAGRDGRRLARRVAGCGVHQGPPQHASSGYKAA